MIKYFCVDESGSYHTEYEQYYIISAVINNELSTLEELHKKIEKVIRKDNNSTKELKGSHMKDFQKALFINELLDNNITIISLAIDKKLINEKHPFKISEFLIYNFALKELVLFAFELDLISIEDIIEMHVDDRNMNHKVVDDLQSYLNLEFFKCINKINVSYKDSKLNPQIQLADYISNTMYGYFNETNDTYRLIENKHLIKYKVFPKVGVLDESN